MLEIRAHNLLCIQGFVGMGYSDKFVDNMTKIVNQLQKFPEALVKITLSPDYICNACPHLSHTGCTLQGEGHEKHMRLQDEVVLKRLGLKEGEEVKWQNIKKRISERIKGRDLTHICHNCPWLPTGVCAKGIDRLVNKLNSKTC